MNAAHRTLACVTPALFALALLGAPAHAADDGPWASLGVLGGSTLVDARLANYQWDTRPRADWGAQALAGAGRFALGARVWSNATVQTLQLPAGDLTPAVRTTTWELVGRARVARVAGTDLWLGGSGGRLGMHYAPERVVVASGPGGDVVADLAPVSAWTVGGGLGADRALAGALRVGLSLDRRMFALDTAHRSGATVIDARESFGDWSTRLELAWRLPLTVKGISR